MADRVVIVGAGQAGCQVAISLRQGGFEGEVILLGREAWLPYQRPPLSKQVLKDGWAADRCLLRPQAFFETSRIDFRPGVVAGALDTAQRRVLLEGGGEVRYDFLVICSGSRLNRIWYDGPDVSAMHYLRTIDDAMQLRDDLVEGARVTIVGAGYIGLEVAASARALGCEVHVVEAQGHIMQRSALPPIAHFLLARHRAEGVTLHLGRQVEQVHGVDRIESVSLDDGEQIASDVLLTGVGVSPDLHWLEGSGLELGRGVRVDAHCRTNIEHVLAAGDCSECAHPLYATPVVLESVQNAVDQGKVAAATILGAGSRYTEAPWFWSEQYDCRFQMAGLPQVGDELIVRETEPGSVSVLSMGGDRLNAVQCVNHPRDFMSGRKLIARGEDVPVDRLRDPACDLKGLLQ